MSPRPASRSSGLPTTSSPLSPRMDSLAMPSQQVRRPGPHYRQHSSGTGASLRLPPLGRFHPANFPSSQSSSSAQTPATGPNSPQSPVSPRTYQKQYTDAQRQMYQYQQQLLAATARSTRGSVGPKPSSPRLHPLGSPGPVTPLELEETNDYFMTGVNNNDAASHVDKLIRKEAQRRRESSPSNRSTLVGGR